MTASQLKHARSIPELGGGGRTIGLRLIELALAVPGGHCIVDIGPWLGSTTAYLSIGAAANPHRPVIHSYDRWLLDDAYAEKARKYHGMECEPGDDILPLWRANMGWFDGVRVPHQGDVLRAEPPGEPIGLFVDDCTIGADGLDKLFAIFGPSLRSECPVVMMDYYHYRVKDGDVFTETIAWFRRFRKDFGSPRAVEAPNNVCAIFRYRGGFE